MLVKNFNSAFKYPDWPVNNVLAFSTSRYHPSLKSANNSSNSHFNAFNLGEHVGDDREKIQAHRQLLLDFFPQNTHIQWLNQTHSSDVVIINTVSNNALSADASITRNKNIALAVMTADCLPILLSSNKGDEIAAIHGGWRPLSNDIIANTLSKMQNLPKHIMAWLGPCIGSHAFEVGVEVKELFVRKSEVFEQAFNVQDNGKYLANLQLIALLQLQQLGVTEISCLAECTFSQEKHYYSYRRESITGRMATLICRI